jgi:hypothetical protein
MVTFDNPAKAAGNTVLSADYNSVIKTIKPFQTQGLYYGTPMSDHDFYGQFSDGKAGEILVVMDVVYLNQADNKWWKAKADYANTLTGMLGIAVSAAAADAQVTILTRGIFRDDSFTSFTAGTDCYVSAATAGLVTQTLGTSGTLLVRRIGYAQATKIIVFDPEDVIHTEVLHTGFYFGAKSHPTVVLSKDNNGVERKFFKDDFSNDTSSQYTASRDLPVWDTANKRVTKELTASNEVTYTSNNYITDSTGTGLVGCSINVDVDSDDNANYRGLIIGLYVNSSNIITIRLVRDAHATTGYIKVYKSVAGVSTQIGSTYSTGDYSGYHRIALSYNSSTGAVIGYLDGVSVVTGTVSDTVFVTSMKFLSDWYKAGATACTYYMLDLTCSPSVAYTDLFAADTSARYLQVTGTVAFNTNHLDLTATDVGAGAYVRERLKSYQFGAGNRLKKIKLPASCTTGDYINVKMCATPDLLLGYGLGVIRQADATWHICTVKDVTVTDTGTEVTGLADGDYCYIETDWDASSGVYWGYVYESTKPTSPQVTIIDATYNYGYTGVVGYAAAGGGAKIFGLYSVTIRANNIIGRTNVWTSETGFYLTDSFSPDSSGRVKPQTVGGVADISGDKLRMKVVTGGGSSKYYFGNISMGNSTIKMKMSIDAASHNDFTHSFMLGSIRGDLETNWGVLQITLAATTLKVYEYNTSGSLIQTVTVKSGLTKGSEYEVNIIWNYPTKTCSVYVTGDAPTVVTYTTALLPSPIGWKIYSSTTDNYCYVDDLVISGTRYYYAPILRGAQVGRALIGGVDTPCTFFGHDCNWDTSLEWTGNSTADTANGYRTLTRSGANVSAYIAKPVMTKGTAVGSCFFKVSTAGLPYYSFGFGGNAVSYYTDGQQWWTGPGWTPMSTTAFPISNGDVVYLQMIFTSTTVGIIYVKNFTTGQVLVTTKTDTAENWTINSYTFYIAVNTANATLNVWDICVNGLDNTATNGVAVSIGGVPHGARGALWDGTFDGYEYAYMDYLGSFPVEEGEYLAGLHCVTTYTGSTKYVRDRVDNTTDSKCLSVESNDYAGKGVALLPGATWGVAGRKRIALTEEDAMDTLRLGVWRDMSAVAIETNPATFISGILFRRRRS